MSEQRVCPRCRQAVDVTASAHLRAHACPHGRTCQPSYKQRRLGVRPEACARCASTSSRQGVLFA